MTAKKMADIFFGKFSELISPKENLDGNNISTNINSNDTNKSNKINKKLIYILGGIVVLGILYFMI